MAALAEKIAAVFAIRGGMGGCLMVGTGTVFPSDESRVGIMGIFEGFMPDSN